MEARYSDLDNPPAGAAMFNHDHLIKQSKEPVESGNLDEAMMSGMLVVVTIIYIPFAIKQC